MATTTNYSWTTPDDTALVKDGAAAIRTLGSSVDTTTKALNPSTTLGDIEYRSSTANTNTRLGIGTTGQVLTVSGGVPAWATSAAGALTLLSTTSLTGSSVTISSISQSYKNLFIVAKNVYFSADNKLITVSLNGTASSHTYGYVGFSASTLVQDSSLNEVSFLWINGVGSTSTNTNLASGVLSIINYTDTGTRNFNGSGLGILNAGTRQSSYVNGTYYAASAVSSIVFTGSGTFSGGSILIYGVN